MTEPHLNFGLRRTRTPLILQTEAAECGLACLAMVVSAFGWRTDLAALRQRFALSLKGLSMADLVQMADRMQLESRALRAELNQIDQLRLPCILHWDLNHFVVLTDVRRGRLTIHDPAHGVRRMTLAEASPHFTGIALELTPGPGFAPQDERRAVRWRDLLPPVSGLKRALAQVLLLALALEAFVLLSPFFMQWVVDDVLVSGDRDLLLTLGIGFSLLVGLQVATAAGRGWAVLFLSATLNQQWLHSVFAHLLRLPMGWFERRQLGDIWSRFSSVQQIQKALTTSFVEALLDGLLVVLTLVMMWLYSPRLTLIALVAVFVYALVRWAWLARLRAHGAEALVHEARQNSHFIESLRGVLAIKLFGAQLDRRARFAALVADTMNADIGTRRIELGMSLAHRLVFGLERVAVIWVGAHLVLDRAFSVGMLFAFFAYKEQFALRVASLIDKAVELRLLRLQGERLADIVLTPPEADADAGAAAVLPATVPSNIGAIELLGVGFRYADSEPEVLSDITLRVEPGESVAITGPSGCGKTTLLKLMLGLVQPTRGEVRVGGVPLARLGLSRWWRAVGVVMQDELLFSGSVADNISFFDTRADRARIEQCARLASVHEEISAMTMGYHTLIGELGSALSGGQKQRLLLARALYKAPQVLLLDEATSALDAAAEQRVNQAVQQLSLTRVIVAHRAETVASASRVIRLDGGRLTLT